jgi:hypothetical protein
MTWTQVNPERFSKYEGMTPADIGRSIMGDSGRTYNLWILREQKNALGFIEELNGQAWEWIVDNPDFMNFWKPAYDLQHKDIDLWTEDDHFIYRALLNIRRGISHRVS